MNALNPDEFHLVQEDEFLPSIGSWITVGGLFQVVIFVAAVALSGVLKYSVTVKAPATIRPSGELRLVQSAIEGTIEQIEVGENQTVKEEEVIARLDDSRLQTKKSQLQGDIQRGELQLAQIKAQLSALDNQIGALNNQIVAESVSIRRSIAAARAELRERQRSYQEQQITAEADWQEALASLNLAAEELARYKQLEDTGIVSRLKVKEKEAALEIAKARISRIKAALNPTDASVDRAKEQIAQEQARVKATLARGEMTLANLRQQKEQLLQSRIEIQNQLHRTKKELQQVETELGGAVIRAPIDGTLLQLNLRNRGQVVRPGEAIAQISPLNAPLIIKARVDAADIDKVETDQTVQMRVSACPYPDYGTLKGTVIAVAPDALPAESSGVGASLPNAYYEVTIQPHNLFVGDKEHWCRLQFGMEGRADIISRQETILRFVLRKARLLTDL